MIKSYWGLKMSRDFLGLPSRSYLDANAMSQYIKSAIESE
jgi:hypothetical protein